MRRDDDWNHYAYRYGEDREAEVGFDVGCALFTPDTHGCCVRVRSAEPEALEAALAKAGDGVWLVGRLRYAGATTLVLQCEDQAQVHAVLPDGVEVDVSEGWGFFDERVCPTDADWRRIADREQLERLVARGLDAAVDAAVVHSFYGTPAGIVGVRERLESEGMEVASCTADRLEMVRVHPPCAISDTTVPLLRFARTRGVAYDGWRLRDPW